MQSESKEESVVEAIKSGVGNYIVKPFTPGKLKRRHRGDQGQVR